MARMDLRLRAWGAVTRRQSSVATRSDADVIALQGRKIPEGGLIGLILGKAAPGVALTDRPIAGPGGDLPVRVYTPAAAATGPRPLIVYFHGGGFVFGGGLRMGDWICSQVAASGRRGRGRGRLPARAGRTVPGRRRGLLRGGGLGGRRTPPNSAPKDRSA